MSERGQAQQEVAAASLRLADAATALEDAALYIEQYDFLAAANAELLRQLRDGHTTAYGLSNDLWNARVVTRDDG